MVSRYVVGGHTVFARPVRLLHQWHFDERVQKGQTQFAIETNTFRVLDFFCNFRQALPASRSLQADQPQDSQLSSQLFRRSPSMDGRSVYSQWPDVNDLSLSSSSAADC